MSLRPVFARRNLRTVVPKLFYRRTSSRPPSLGNAFLRGLVIGGTSAGTLAVAGYIFYRVSGAKKIVDTVQHAMVLLEKSQESLAQGAFGSALKYLREAAKAYVSTVPFAGFLVDKAFDAAEDVAATHSAEANAIIIKAYHDISSIIREQGSEHVTRGAILMMAAARRFWTEMLALGAKAGQPLSQRLNLETRVPEATARASVAFGSVKSQANAIFKGKTKDAEAVSDPQADAVNECQSERQSVSDQPGLPDRLVGISTNAVDAVKASVPSALEKTKTKAQDIFSMLKPKVSPDSTSKESPQVDNSKSTDNHT